MSVPFSFLLYCFLKDLLSPFFYLLLANFNLKFGRVKIEKGGGRRGIRKKNPERVWAPGNYY